MQRPQQHEEKGNNASHDELKKKHGDDLRQNRDDDDEEILFADDDDDFSVRRLPRIQQHKPSCGGDDENGNHQQQEEQTEELEEVPLFSGGTFSNNAVSTFDPYKSPRGGARGAAATTTTVASSLLDSSMEEEEDEDDLNGGGGVALASLRNTKEDEAFLEMETSSSIDYGDDHHHHQFPPIPLQGSNSSGIQQEQKQYNYYYAPACDPIKTSSGLLLTHRRTPVPAIPAAAPTTTAAVTGHTPLFPHGITGSSSTNNNPMRHPKQQAQQQQYYGGNSSFSAFPSGGNLNSKKSINTGKTNSGGIVRGRFFEVENLLNTNSSSDDGNVRRGGGDSFLRQAQRMLSFVRIWVILSAIILIVGTAIVLHHMRRASSHDESKIISSTTTTSRISSSSSLFQIQPQQDGSRLVVPVNKQQQQNVLSSYNYESATTDRVVLLPLSPEMIQQQQRQQEQQISKNNHHLSRHVVPSGHRRSLKEELRDEFEDWMHHHGKRYQTHQVKEERFSIWAMNHERTLQKNQQHGPCKLTGKAVFGSNHFKDLTPSEFQDLYLNSKKPRPREEERQQLQQQRRTTASVLKPPPPVQQQQQDEVESNSEMMEDSLPTQPVHHPEVHRRIQELWDRPRVKGSTRSSSYNSYKRYNCSWWDVSCILKYIFETFVYGFYGIGTTMEPAYDADSYPTAVDWRDVGAVTEVRTQDGCGACWAITAVETVESANFLSFGVLYDLSETEVIVCSTECEMCDGGWPEEAFDYIIEHNGVPLSKDMSYDGNWLLAVSNSKSGASDTLDSSTVKAYMSATCPSGGGGGGGNSRSSSGSQDQNDNYDYGDGDYGFTENTYSRYGSIKGYGYGTDRCVCYTDGTGCDCDDQDEGLAVGNLATYGPAVVCIDASVWQDYQGGIITSSSGCSAKFLDVNHCVQVVGYAFASDQGNDEQQNGDQNSRSGSGSHSGSQDDEDRSGYWIVRNQWSAYWGMNGYAYVAMGENTCGILNNMIQAYTKNK